MGLSKVLFSALLRSMGAKRMFHRAARARRAELTEECNRLFGNTVQSGPFAGMTLPDASSWGDGDRVSKLLGVYEANLHAPLRRAVERAPQTVINVGCAEGYYAVGFARLLPGATVFAFDIDTRAGEVCRNAARANGVGDRVVVGGLCSVETLAEVIKRPGGVLVFLDCEGAERELVDPTRLPDLARCDVLVETHDFVVRGTTELLEQRLCSSHRVERIAQGGRDPNAVPEFSQWAELDRWLMVDEGRPEVMSWLAAWAGL